MNHPIQIRRSTLLVLVIVSFVSTVNADDVATGSSRPFRIVGYLPDYRVEMTDPAIGKDLTDLVFFSVVPDPRGDFESKFLESPKTKTLLKKLRDEYKTQIHLCVGGWERSQGFAAIAATPASRKKFASGLSHYCRHHHFAGADLDWEHPQNAVESKNYGLLLSEIAHEFKPHGLRLTAAMAAWQTLTPEGIKAVDAIHLMSYDADGKHSTFEQSKIDVQKFLDAKVPAEKIRLGLPFYGRGIVQRDLAKPWSEIAPLVKSSETDELDGLYFNGPATIRAKTGYAKQQKLGGVMIWEIGQDASGDASLLKVIRETD